MNTSKVEFKSERLEFLELKRDDVELIHLLHSIPEVDEFNTLGIPKDMNETKEVLKAMIEGQSKIPRKIYTWKITLVSNHDFIGLAGLTLSRDKFRIGEIYYKLLPKHWGKGFATETSRKLIRIGFDEFNLHRIEAGVATENQKSINVLEKSGMVREGLRRKILPIRGQWIDNYHYGILEDDPR